MKQEEIQECLQLIKKDIISTVSGMTTVIKFMPPETLQQYLDFNIPDNSLDSRQIIDIWKKVMETQVHCCHPHFHNQLFAGFDQFCLAGDWLASALEGRYTQKFQLFKKMEDAIYQQLKLDIGWETIAGNMPPGGSYGNLYGQILARSHKFPDTKKTGIRNSKKLCIFTSSQSHYSVSKNAIIMGHGIQNVKKVKVNQNTCQMIPQELEKSIKQAYQNGLEPYMVIATVGTTVAGAIDPVKQIVEIGKKYNLWIHVDAALGGSFIINKELRKKLQGLQQADSIVWDPHKGSVAPLQTTIFVTKHKNSMDYLNILQENDNEQEFGLQFSKHLDTLKYWLKIRGNGLNKISQEVMKCHQNILYCYQQYKNKYHCEMLFPVGTFQACFFYIPIKMRNQQKDSKFYQTLNKMNVQAKRLMIEEGQMMVGYSKTGKYTQNYFWRHVLLNPRNSKQDLDFEMQKLVFYCQKAILLI